eukprot:622034_1
MRDQIEEHNCSYKPRVQPWYLLAQKIGVGRSEWTEPYVFADARFGGMSYVAPVIWKQHHLIFVVQVTLHTLARAVSHQVQHLPIGALWMIVTPGKNAVASSNNETMIDVAGCDECATNDSKIIAAIEWMKENDIDKQEHFAALAIGSAAAYDISIYSFKMNHVNLFPPKAYDTQSNNESDYQYGYVVIVNDDSYLQKIRYAWWLSCALPLLSFTWIMTWIGCNARYSNIEQRSLISAMHSKRLQIVETNLNLFQKVPIILPQMDTPVVGDRVRTIDNQYGKKEEKITSPQSCCFISQKWLRRVLFACVMIDLIGIIAIWELLTTKTTVGLFENVMATH